MTASLVAISSRRLPVLVVAAGERIRTGAPWRDLPEKYGKWMTVYQRFRRWSEAGIWEAVATTLAQAMAGNSRHSPDSTALLKRSLVSSESGRGERPPAPKCSAPRRRE